VLDNTFGPVKSVSSLGAIHIPERVDEQGETYAATADDAAYSTFMVGDDIVVQINSSWATRVHRDELFVLQVDGTEGSAIAGLRGCKAQHRAVTPKPVWNPDIRIRSTSTMIGRTSPTTSSSKMPSRCSGRCSSSTLSVTRRTRST
jgi:predicted dehydrogenase